MHKKQGEKKCIPLFFYKREVFLEIHQMYLACVVAAVAGGATVCSHFNDSGFWLVRSLIGVDEKTTLKTWTIMETLVGGTGFLVALVISFFV